MNAITQLAAPVESTVLADSLLNFVARAMADPNVNVDKLQVLLRMQREIVADDARLQFSRSMSLAQGEMQAVLRDASNDQTKSRYARLETIDAAIRPVYVRHGFCLEFNSESIEGPNERIVCEVSHSAGHAKKFQLEAAPDTAGPQGKPNKTPLHGLGSTVSYLRRYLTCMIFNVVVTNEDNDGNRQQTPSGKNAEERVNGCMTAAELKILDDLMVLTRSSEGAFLTYHGLDYRSIQQVPATQFVRLKNSLLAKVRVLTEREAFAAKARAAEARQPQNRDPGVVGKMMDSWDANKHGARS